MRNTTTLSFKKFVKEPEPVVVQRESVFKVLGNEASPIWSQLKEYLIDMQKLRSGIKEKKIPCSYQQLLMLEQAIDKLSIIITINPTIKRLAEGI